MNVEAAGQVRVLVGTAVLDSQLCSDILSILQVLQLLQKEN